MICKQCEEASVGTYEFVLIKEVNVFELEVSTNCQKLHQKVMTFVFEQTVAIL